MGRLIVWLLVGAGIWMGLWVAGSILYERGLNAWIEARRAEGWAADVQNLDVAGFPNRFDTTLTDVRMADPVTGVAWSAPFVQFLSLAYKPHQVIAVLPEQHVFSTPLQTMTIDHERARGSLFLGASTALPLERAVIVIDALTVSSSLGWDVTLGQGRVAAEAVAAANDTYRIGAEFSGLTPSLGTRAVLDPGDVLPDTVETVRLDATLAFTDPWDRSAIEVARPQITAIDLDDLSARWGDVTFRAAGELTVDAAGVPEGRITVKTVEWRRLLDMAIGTGLLADTFRPALEGALELMASLEGPSNTLDAPLTFEKGFISFGPIPLGPAPRIVIR
ncbi:MAG: DUF2125 domain-containing protein [Rhodobacteraceae bacterium]|nr:MAG: DUF2125 domain-containing protein [Paracoccaceae bacterium]